MVLFGRKITWWYVLLAAFFFNPFVIVPARYVCYLVFYGVPLVYLIFHWTDALFILRTIFTSRLSIVIYLYLALVVLSIAIPLAHGTGDYSYLNDVLLGPIKDGLRILFLAAVFIRYLSQDCDWELFAIYYALGMCCYVLGTCVFIALPDLRAFWMSILNMSDFATSEASKQMYLTRFGWQGYSNFGQTFRCALAVIFLGYSIGSRIAQTRFADYIPLLLVLVGTFFYGRIGVLVSAIAIIVQIIVPAVQNRPKVLLVFLGIIVVACVIAAVLYNANEAFRRWFNWAFAIVINFFSTGQLGDYSTKVLFERMLWMPEGHTLLFGDGMYEADGGYYYMGTDSGLMRPVLFGGIGFALVRYAIAVVMFVWGVKMARKMDDKHLLAAVIVILICLVIFEIKGEILSSMTKVTFAVAVLMEIKDRIAYCNPS